MGPFRSIARTVTIALMILSVSPAQAQQVAANEKECMRKAVDCIKNSEYDEAIELLTKSMRINGRSSKSYTNRGAAYFRKKDFARAISDFSSAIELDPLSAEAYHNRGVIYFKIESLEKAISDFSKAIEINPAYANAYNSRAIALYHKKEYNKSRADAYKAEQLGFKVDPEFLEEINSRKSGLMP